MRHLSFLGEAALPHYQAVSELLEPGARVRQARLAELATVAGPAMAFLCGLPFVRLHDAGGAVEAIAAPVPDGGLEAPVYHSDLVGRMGAGGPLAAMRIGFNGEDSLSGWVLPRLGLRRAGIDPDTLTWIRTGSHRASLRQLVEGELDAAPIDSTVLVLERRATPGVERLPVLARFGPMPAPPVVLLGAGPREAADVRNRLIALGESAAGRRALALGGVQRYVAVTSTDYHPVRQAVSP